MDHCFGCGGTLLEPGKAAASIGVHAEPTTWLNTGASELRGPTEMHCPRDGGVLHEWVVHDGKRDVVVDVCDACKALWLDRNECGLLREIVLTAGQDRKRFTRGEEGSAGSVKGYLFRLVTGLPGEVWNPTHRKPVLNHTLVAFLALLFVVQVATGIYLNGDPQGLGGWTPFLGLWLVPTEIWAADNIQTLLTYAFLHGGFAHLAVNLYFLWLFGDNVEDYLGHRKYTAIFLASALAGAVLHVLMPGDASIPLVGASGGIAGLMGAYLVLFPGVRLRVVWLFIPLRLPLIAYIALWLLSQGALMLGNNANVSWQAHLGGFIAGGILATRWRKRPVTDLCPELARTPASG